MHVRGVTNPEGKKGLMQRLSRQKWVAIAAVYTLLASLLLSAIHTAALAAAPLAAANGSSNPNSWIFQICTPSGLVELPRQILPAADDADAYGQAQASVYCPICNSPLASPFAQPQAEPVLPAPDVALATIPVPRQQTRNPLALIQHKRIRAPPA